MDQRDILSDCAGDFAGGVSGFERWARNVGYFGFYRSLGVEVERFRDTFGFDVRLRGGQPPGRDGLTVAFLVSMPGWDRSRQYALYGRLVGENVHVWLGWVTVLESGGVLTPYRQIGDYDNLSRLTAGDLSDWLRGLLRMHCEKI